MRIAILQGAFLPVPPTRGGAVEKLWWRLGEEIARAGISVTHISRRVAELPARSRGNGVEHIRIQGFDRPNGLARQLLLDLLYTMRAIVALRRLGSTDLIVTNTFFAPILFPIFLHAKIYVSVHRLPKWQYRLYTKADRFQCVSSSVGDALKAGMPRLRSKVEVIPNFVNLPEKVTPIGERMFAGRRVLLYVGRIHAEKGLHLLVEAFLLLPQHIRKAWTLKLVGPFDIAAGGSGEQYARSLDRHSECCGSGSIELTGPVYDEIALQSVYQSASLFVYPSLAREGEAFGLAPLEAMANGVPCVVSDLPCFRDFVEDGNNGWIVKLEGNDSARALSQCCEMAISEMETNPTRMSSRALETAANFNVSNVAAQLVIDFEKVVLHG